MNDTSVLKSSKISENRITFLYMIKTPEDWKFLAMFFVNSETAGIFVQKDRGDFFNALIMTVYLQYQ